MLFQDRQLPAQTIYDVLGRTLKVQAPDGNYTQRITYADLQVQVKDANNNITTTSMDVWGRTTAVDPPGMISPSVSYTYDVKDQLLTSS